MEIFRSAILVILIIYAFVASPAHAQDYYKRLVNRAGYSLTNIESHDPAKRKARVDASDLIVHGGLQMKLSPLWSGQVELSLRRQTFQNEMKDTSYLMSGQFDLRRKIFTRFDGALLGGLKQENFLFGNGQGELSTKKLSLPMLGLQTYSEIFRFITSGISLKLAYLRYFGGGSDDINISNGSAYRLGLVYLLRYRQIDWSLEYLHERSRFQGNYSQENTMHSLNLGLAYE